MFFSESLLPKKCQLTVVVLKYEKCSHHSGHFHPLIFRRLLQHSFIIFFCIFLLLICLLVISHFRKISFLPSPRYLLIQDQYPNQTFLASVFLHLSQTFQEYQLLLHFVMKMWLSWYLRPSIVSVYVQTHLSDAFMSFWT